MQKARDLGWLNIDAATYDDYRGMVVRAPSVIYQSYTRKNNKESFTRPGWLDEATLQGPDTLKMFETLKISLSSLEIHQNDNLTHLDII